MDPELRESLSDLPPSAKLVFTVLEAEGRLTQKELAAETRLSPRTVRYALNELQEIDVVSRDVSFIDARKRIYSLAVEDHEAASSAG